MNKPDDVVGALIAFGDHAKECEPCGENHAAAGNTTFNDWIASTETLSCPTGKALVAQILKAKEKARSVN